MDKNISEIFDYGDEIVVVREQEHPLDPARIKELTMKKINNDVFCEKAGKFVKKAHPMYRTILIAAVLAVLLIGTALAVGLHTDFFHHAYGDGTSHGAFDVQEHPGSVVTYPAMEAAEVDERLSETRLGDYIADVNKSITIGGYTLTIGEMILDENGIGTMTVDIENPDGLELTELAGGNFTCPAGISVYEETDGLFDAYLASKAYPVTGSVTDTSIRYVYYFASAEHWTPGAPLFAEVSVAEASGAPLEERTDIPALPLVPAVRFAGDGISGELSSVGLTLTWDIPEDYIDVETRVTVDDEGNLYLDGELLGNMYMDTDLYAREIHPFEPGLLTDGGRFSIIFDDGEEYVIEAEGILNTPESYRSGWTVYYAFNRIVDVDSVERIMFDGIVLTPAY